MEIKITVEEINELEKKLRVANQEYLSATVRKAGVVPVREQLRNILFNRREQIVEALSLLKSQAKQIAEKQEIIDSLNAALKEDDDEVIRLRKQIKEYKKKGTAAEE